MLYSHHHMASKKQAKSKEGYSIREVRSLTSGAVQEAVEDLRARLRAAWKKRAAAERRIRHGTAV